MIYSIRPFKDATIYDKSIYQNTGLDEILELSKILSGSEQEVTTVSRILIKFNTTDIQNVISQSNSTNFRFYLRLFTSNVSEIPLSYTVQVLAVSQSWEMGVGRLSNSPITTDGVSWRYRDRYNGNMWATSSYAPGSAGAYYFYPGGGTWYTGYDATQSFEYESTDLRVDVTNIVNAWLSGTIENDGFIIKRLTTDEQNDSDMGTLKFFSKETHTIYSPKLEIAWDDSVFITGSLTEITSDDDYLIYIPNLEKTYNKNEKVKIRVIGRPKYSNRTYSTQSVYTTVTHYLPTSSYYSIIDASSNDIIIPFDNTYTKLSCDVNGNYFKLWMDCLEADRVYQLKIKVKTKDIENIFDAGVFKVVK